MPHPQKALPGGASGAASRIGDHVEAVRNPECPAIVASVWPGLTCRCRPARYSTGLSKRSIAKAINEAERAGIIDRHCRQGGKDGRALPSVYAIDWSRVQTAQ